MVWSGWFGVACSRAAGLLAVCSLLVWFCLVRSGAVWPRSGGCGLRGCVARVVSSGVASGPVGSGSDSVVFTSSRSEQEHYFLVHIQKQTVLTANKSCPALLFFLFLCK